MRPLFLSVAAVAALAACDRPAEIEANEAVPAAEPAPSEAPDARGIQTPEDMVHAFYLEPAIPNEPAAIRRYFTEDFVEPLTPLAGIEGSGADFDYRFDAQDVSVGRLVIEEIAAGPTGSRVEASFSNFGQPTRIGYDLCRRQDGQWRISDVDRGDGGWSLRALMDMGEHDENACR